MNLFSRTARRIAASCLLTAAMLVSQAGAQILEPEDVGMGEADVEAQSWGRWEIWLGPVFWPSLGDLTPEQGDFDTVGLGLGLGFHLPIRQFEHSDLLVGVDLSISGIDSNIDGFMSTVMARHAYVGVSAKWAFLEDRNAMLDFGVGLHMADMAELSTVYWGMEYTLWEATRGGAFVGATWDISRGLPGRKNGLFVGFKAHFVDFGNVYDEDILFFPMLGSAAGRAEGPIYMLQIGYAAR